MYAPKTPHLFYPSFTRVPLSGPRLYWRVAIWPVTWNKLHVPALVDKGKQLKQRPCHCFSCFPLSTKARKCTRSTNMFPVVVLVVSLYQLKQGVYTLYKHVSCRCFSWFPLSTKARKCVSSTNMCPAIVLVVSLYQLKQGSVHALQTCVLPLF